MGLRAAIFHFLITFCAMPASRISILYPAPNYDYYHRVLGNQLTSESPKPIPPDKFEYLFYFWMLYKIIRRLPLSVSFLASKAGFLRERKNG